MTPAPQPSMDPIGEPLSRHRGSNRRLGRSLGVALFALGLFVFAITNRHADPAAFLVLAFFACVSIVLFALSDFDEVEAELKRRFGPFR